MTAPARPRVIHRRLLTTPTARQSIVTPNGKGMVKKMPPAALEDSVPRPRNTELVIDPHLAQWAFRVLTRLAGLYAVVVGSAILLGGEERFAGLSYAVALETPGAPESWGLWILGGGLLIIIGSLWAKPRIIGAGAIIGAMWALLFAIAFTRAALTYGQANTTAPWVYAFLFGVFGTIAGVHFAMHPIRFRRLGA